MTGFSENNRYTLWPTEGSVHYFLLFEPQNSVKMYIKIIPTSPKEGQMLKDGQQLAETQD